MNMQLYLADCRFQDIELQKAAYAKFVELWESGAMAKEDKFEGFELLFRVHAPEEGRVINGRPYSIRIYIQTWT